VLHLGHIALTAFIAERRSTDPTQIRTHCCLYALLTLMVGAAGLVHGEDRVPVYIRAHFLLATGDGKPELKWSTAGADAHHRRTLK
jgi:hypothetical protein